MTSAPATPEPKYVAETLAWCNRQRAKKGKPPLAALPRGRRSIASSCPCGKATDLSVYQDEAYGYDANGHRKTVRVNQHVAAFITAFDDGKLPQYDINVRRKKA